MENRLINIHSHVFNSKCAAKDFLQTSLPAAVPEWLAINIKSFLDRGDNEGLLNFLNRLPGSNAALKKYMSLIRIGSESTQLRVFINLFQQWQKFDSNVAIVGLTMDMDSSTDVENRPNTSLETQLWEIMDIKAKYPNHFYPFIGVDPRTKSGKELADWVNIWVVKNKVFSGVKLYPALGFFPFDSRLTELYALCEAEQIPIITHTTRGGSFNTSKNIVDLVRRQITYCLNPNHPNYSFIKGLLDKYAPRNTNLFKRFGRWWPNRLGGQTNWASNENICNLFSHPANHHIVLDMFPKLRLCFAHFGGSYEVYAKNYSKVPSEDGVGKWYSLIKEMMLKYDEVYADLSYTHSETEALKVVACDMRGNAALENKVLFGTDYYLVESEGSESHLLHAAIEELNRTPGLFEKLSKINNKNFLGKYI